VQAPLGRREATFAALIPIKKSAAWWELTQEQRRAIFEDKSRHIAAA
jgi:chlorite dismutase